MDPLIEMDGTDQLRQVRQGPVMFWNSLRDITIVFLISVVLVTFSLWLQRDIGYGMGDEGYFWYGVLQTASGKVPIRDFQSYNPGRYYWAAFWSLFLGDGIIALRTAIGIFQIIGLTLALATLRSVVRSWPMLALSGIVILVWMVPGYKVFESVLSIVSVFFCCCLLRKRTVQQYFICGVFVGLAAFFGRNHGLYNFAAFLLLILFIWFKIDRTQLIRRLGAWAVGIVLGYSPMLIMMLLVHGFFESWYDNLISILRRPSMNIPLPVPWPWRHEYRHLSFEESSRVFYLSFEDNARVFFTGMLFLFLPLWYVVSIFRMLRIKKENWKGKTVLISSTFVGIMYMHHVFSRAEIRHLAQGIHPLLIGVLTLLLTNTDGHRKLIKGTLLLLLCVTSFFSVSPITPYYQKLVAKTLVYYDVRGDRVWLRTRIAHIIDGIKSIGTQRVGPGEGLLVAPYWPGVYPILRRQSPLRESYLLHPETASRQHEMIDQLKEKNVNWVILAEPKVDLEGRGGWRFRNTHRVLWKHLIEDFEAVESPLPRSSRYLRYLLLHRKEEAAASGY